MLHRIWQRYGLLIGLGLIGLFKLWVIHTDEIYGSSAEYDALWYVGSAKDWYWFRPYSWTAFVRPCAYPLFIAAVHFVGMPLRIAIELVQMAGFAVLLLALCKARVPRWLCLFLFALMVLHPASFLYNTHTMSESFYTAVLAAALGASLLALFTKKIGHAVGAGVAYAVLWNTREESFLIPLILVVIFALALWQRRDAPTRKAHFLFWLKRMAALGAAMFVLIVTVYSANYATYRAFAKSDMSSPAFEGLFKALLRIKPSYSLRYIAVNVEALRMAYEVSPTFAQLKPQFEGVTGHNWTNPVFDNLGVREYGPWFMWALRNITADAGYYKDSITTNAFYRKAAREINQACDEDRIPSRFVISGFLDPGAVSRIRYLPRSIVSISRLFLFRHHKVMVRADTNLVPWMDSLYQEMVFRQPQPQPGFYPETNAVVIPDTTSARLAVTVENFIGTYYVYLFMTLAWAGVAAFAVMMFFLRRWRFGDSLVTIVTLFGTTIIARIVFFAFLEATWWMAGYERYLWPIMPLASCFLVLLVYSAFVYCRKTRETPATSQGRL